MQKIEITKQFLIGDAIIDEVSVHPVAYAGFADIWQRASARVTKSTKIETLLQRERIRAQAHFMAKGKRVIPDDAAISQLPIITARAIIAALDEGQGEAGEVMNEGDGISKPMLYKLGTPIAMAGKDAKPISELEFMASTYGEIEDVLAADNTIMQALQLIRTVAKPIEHESLQVLPSWAVDRITMADGVTIARKVLSSFL